MDKKNKFCKFTNILSIVLLFYILITTYLDYFKTEEYLSDNILIFKLVFLFIIFISFCFNLVFLKFYKDKYLKKELVQRTNEIINENERLKIHSHIDPLTQCLNQKYFIKRFEEEIKRAIREKQYLSLFILDIDEFKSFNDIYGKNEGDECLKLIANILVNHCHRPVDLVCRFTDDKFYVLLPNTTDPYTIANNCINSVRRLNIPHENSIASNILTVSIGVSTLLPLHVDQKDELLSKARYSLFEAKKNGRNRIK